MSTGSATETDKKMQTEESRGEERTGWRYALYSIRQDRTARFGLYIIAAVSFMAVFSFIDSLLGYPFAERFLYHPERTPDGAVQLLPPVGFENQFGEGVWAHPLGTDHHGRDILVRIIYGSQVAIGAGFLSAAIGAVGGTIIGCISGYYGGYVDDALMRFVEVLYAIPFLVLALAFLTVFGRNLLYAMVGVAIASMPIFARLIRSRVFSVREKEFVEAARAAGIRDRNIIFRHVLPNSYAPVLVQATLQIGVNILIIAGLSFLGFGAQPPTASWGAMLSNARNYMLPNMWFSVWPGIAILITVMGFNMFGDGLQDALDPRIEN